MPGKYKNLIQRLVEAPLASVAFHSNTPSITRLSTKHNLPISIGVHCVSRTDEPPTEYSILHSHDSPELNILISSKGCELVYKLRFEDEIYTVSAPATVWIPAGLKHSANLVSGEGNYICLKYRASQNET